MTALQDMFATLCGSGIRIDMHVGEEPLYALADPGQFIRRLSIGPCWPHLRTLLHHEARRAANGMALAQAVDFAERASGVLQVNSTVGAGATFPMCLPRVDGPVDGDRAGGSLGGTTKSRPVR